MIEIGNDRDDGNYNPLMVPQYFHRSSNFFGCGGHHRCCERTASGDRSIIGAQVCSIRDRMLHDDSFTVVTRRDIDLPPNIIPPLPKTGCENLEDGDKKKTCEVDVQSIIITAACVGAGLVIVPALFFVAWTLARWIRVVRPRKETILIGKEAKKKATGQNGRGTWVSGGGQIQERVLGKEAHINVKKVRSRIEEKEVWYGGVRMTMPWGRGDNWNRAASSNAGLLIKRTDKWAQVAQLPSTGTAHMLVGMSPNSSSIYILEPGQFDRGSRAAGRSTLAVSEHTRDDGIRVMSTGMEAPTERGVVSQRKPSCVGEVPDLERG